MMKWSCQNEKYSLYAKEWRKIIDVVKALGRPLFRIDAIGNRVLSVLAPECANGDRKRQREKKGSKMKLHDRKETIIAILGSAAVLMLLVGCAGEKIQKRTEQEVADISSQLQQNIEEDLSDGLSPDQSEESEQLERSEEAEQSEETEQLLNVEAGDQVQDELDAERIIEEQSFQVELNDWGEVRFVSYEPTRSERDMQEDVTFYLLKDKEILYQFPYAGEGHSSGYGFYWDVKFVMFTDTNADGREDVVIGAEYMTGIGPQGAIPHTEVRIYEDCGEYFTYNEALSNEINDYLPWESNVLAQDIKRLLQLANGNEPLTNYESYTGKWTVGPGYVAAYENPMPESGNKLICSISNGNEFYGNLFTEQEKTERIASVEDIAGTIQNGELFYEFTDDGWGGAGMLHIMFLPNQINVEILNHQIAEESTIGYGVSGSYEMTIRE